MTRFADGAKKKTLLLEDLVAGNGRFTAQVAVSTDQAQQIVFQVKAKDDEKNKVKLGAIVSVLNTATAPSLTELAADPPALETQSGPQVVTSTGFGTTVSIPDDAVIRITGVRDANGATLFLSSELSASAGFTIVGGTIIEIDPNTLIQAMNLT